MTTQITWSDDLLVKVPAIDDDHKKLFALMNEIFTSASLGADAINRAIGALVTYTKEHFAREEASMTRAEYPGLADHKYAHEHLVFRLDTMINQLLDFGPAAIDAELAKFLRSWLSDHIMSLDIKYAAYLRETGQQG
jgi:hemerythrin